MSKIKPNTLKKTKILFVDQKNNLASQLAEHYAKQMYADDYDVYSAGPESDIVDCDLLAVMYVAGEDLRDGVSKTFGSEGLPKNFDVVVYLQKSTYDECASKTAWQGKQILADMGTREDAQCKDDSELSQYLIGLAEKVSTWVENNLEDPSALIKKVVETNQ